MVMPDDRSNVSSESPVRDVSAKSRDVKAARTSERPLAEKPLLGEAFGDELLKKGERPAYDARTAYALAVISAWSYSDKVTLAKKLRFYGFPDCTVSHCAVINDALFVVATAYVVRSKCGRLAIIVFRGTEPINLVSWLTDSDVITCAPPREWHDQGRIHRGFFSNFEAVWDDVATQLRHVPEGGKPVEAIYVTGHSLGGAMAVLAAAQLVSTNEFGAKLRGVYTYGQPAVGDQSFADWGRAKFGQILFRHVYNHDLVPQLPPTSTGTFVHFGHEHDSTGRGEKEVWKCARTTTPVRFALWAGLGVLLEFAARRTTWFRHVPFPNSIGDHSPAFYVTTSRNHARAESNACKELN